MAQAGGGSKTYFTGLPIPGAAGLLASFVIVYQAVEQQDPAHSAGFLTNQVLRAKYFTDTTAGTVAAPAASAAYQPLGFFREEPLIAGEYLLGFYNWSGPVTLATASVIAWAPQATPTPGPALCSCTHFIDISLARM